MSGACTSGLFFFFFWQPRLVSWSWLVSLFACRFCEPSDSCWGFEGERARKTGIKCVLWFFIFLFPLVFRLCLYRNGAHKAIAKRERDRDRTSGLHSFSFLVLILTVLTPLFCLSFPNLNLSPSHELKNFCHILERRFCFDFEPRSKWFFLLGLTFC